MRRRSDTLMGRALQARPSVRQPLSLSPVELDVNGQRLVASITVEAARELGLQEGKAVTAIIKASDVMLATAD